MYCHKSLAELIWWQLRFKLVLVDTFSEALSSQDVLDALEHVFMRQEVEFAVAGVPWDLGTKVTLRLADYFLVWTVDRSDSWVGQLLHSISLLILPQLALI